MRKEVDFSLVHGAVFIAMRTKIKMKIKKKKSYLDSVHG